MPKEQFIISLTSYPERICSAVKAIHSLIKQKTDVDYKIVLVLAELQFQNKTLLKEIIDYQKSGKLEIIWHPTDIRSHKKLIPTLLKYPDATVIITDDDIERPDWWLQMFIDDHRKNPNDVIVGLSAWRLSKDLKNVGAANVRPKNYSFPCVTEPDMILLVERPANGLGGVLYPNHTFTRPEFFDESLFMRLSPYSDESWQYCFNVIENRTLRLCSKPLDWSKFTIKGSQNTALSKHNTFAEYSRLYKLLMDEFPEYKENMTQRLNKYYNISESHELNVENKSIKHTVYCQLTGRLGNNLFQIATARYYAEKHNLDVKFYFPDAYKSDLDDFNISGIQTILKSPIELITEREIKAIKNIFRTKETSSITYTEIPFDDNRDILITGNRQSEKYFNKQFIVNLFEFSKLDKEIENVYGDLSDIGAIHIRRTDYINSKRHYRSIYEDDVIKIREKFPNDDFIIFSDDIKWCKEKFSGMNFKFADYSSNSGSVFDLVAMSKCMCVIMSNSTYSWWAAYLNKRPGHITVYKHPWFTDSKEYDIIPNDKSWMTIDVFLNL